MPSTEIPSLPAPVADDNAERHMMRTPSGVMLSPRQYAFVNNYLSPEYFMKEYDAAIAAGYSEKHARTKDILSHPPVRAEIELRLRKIAMQNTLTPEEVISKMWEEAQNKDPDIGSPNARVQALKTLMEYFSLVGRNVKDPSQRKQINININLSGKSAKVTADRNSEELTIDVSPEHKL